MAVGVGTICFACRHLVRGEVGEDPDTGSSTAVCAAFPDGIPLEIWKGGFDHRRSHPDHDEVDGVLFELDEEEDDAEELLGWYESEVLPAREAMIAAAGSRADS